MPLLFKDVPPCPACRLPWFRLRRLTTCPSAARVPTWRRAGDETWTRGATGPSIKPVHPGPLHGLVRRPGGRDRVEPACLFDRGSVHVRELLAGSAGEEAALEDNVVVYPGRAPT